MGNEITLGDQRPRARQRRGTASKIQYFNISNKRYFAKQFFLKKRQWGMKY